MQTLTHQTLVHMIPGLGMFSSDLMADVRANDAIELVIRRFDVLVNNIDEINEHAQNISYMPKYVYSLIQRLAKLSEFGHIAKAELKAVLNECDKYNHAIIVIVSTHEKIVEVIQSAKEITLYEARQASQALQQSAFHAH